MLTVADLGPSLRWRVCAVNVEEDGDNPPFDGVFEFCQAYAGATLGTLPAPVAVARWPWRCPQPCSLRLLLRRVCRRQRLRGN